ncbi:hypothetical protein [Pseudomonas sp. RL_15y_Pfl2_60]|uniref:hypothetical protein n=1 Tax=Pseudomonas sp. RL_15y_Pfl2_60 TaxID=3088709 RepID=UPI0030D8A2DB
MTRFIGLRGLVRTLAGAGSCGFSAAVFATSQCPPEFAEKSQLSLAMGWTVIALGLLLGLVALGFAWRYSRKRSLAIKLACRVAAVLALLTSAAIGLGVALSVFFLNC